MIACAFTSLGDIADAIDALPRAGYLSTRAVLMSSKMGYAVRRRLIETGRGAALAGTRFIPPIAFAIELLEGAGIAVQPGADALRPAKLLHLFRRGLTLRHFPLELLRENPGWEEAFAKTLGDLEGAGMSPEALEDCAASLGADADIVRDVARVWRALNAAEETSWSRARIFAEATRVVRGQHKHLDDSVLAGATGHESAVLARFLSAIPNVKIAISVQRPAAPAWLARVEAVFGAEARMAVAAARDPLVQGREIDLLRSALFAPPEDLAASARPRSRGPDGTVELAEHAGLEEELESSSDWVAEQILAGTPLREIAVIAPRAEPWCALLAERLRRLPWHDRELPIFVSGGLACVGSSSGARLLALVRGLRSFLPMEQMPAILVALRAADGGSRLDHAGAIGLAGSLGTAGGNAARPEGAREWAARARARLNELANADDAASGTKKAQTHWAEDALLEQLEKVLPALEALDQLAALISSGGALREVSKALEHFCEAHLLQPGEGAPPGTLLAAALEPLAQDECCGALTGDEALRVIESEILGLRWTEGCFGDPAIFIGTVSDAAGLSFRALRIIGLCEGALPSSPREDTVLPDERRKRLAVPGLKTTSDQTLAQLHALQRCVAGARDQLVLSAPRTDADGSQRLCSAVLLDALAALGRPGTEPIDLPALQRAAFRPARMAAERRREASPISLAAQLWGTVRGVGLPLVWHRDASLDLRRIRALKLSKAIEGQLGESVPLRALPGLSAQRAISASRLSAFLACPHRFLWNNALGWDEPAELPSTGQLAPMTYGTLFHAVAETFFKEHGEDFGTKKRSPTQWKKIGDRLAAEAFADLCTQQPLAGNAVKDQQLDRLQRDIAMFLEHEWREGNQPQHVELSFGNDVPIQIKLASGALHVKGKIDRIDVDVTGERTLVRDLKSGRAHPRRGEEAGPTLGVDLQLGLHGLVVKQLAGTLHLPKKIGAAYVNVDRAGERDRTFRNDYAALEEAARGWLDTAMQLFTARAFPRTPSSKDCSRCAFHPVCGDSAADASLGTLIEADGALAAFLDARGGNPEESEA